MELAEFTCHWAGNYTPEQEKTYRMIHGEDRDEWPPTQDETPIVIDLEKVIRFNPHHDEDKTTVELHGGMSFSLVIPFDRFKTIMQEKFPAIKDYSGNE